MGGFVDFRCRVCRYEESNIGIGRGKNEFPFLALFHCDHCKSVGSTWVHPDRSPVCSHCYHDAVTVLPADIGHLNCPRCGEPPTSCRKKSNGIESRAE